MSARDELDLFHAAVADDPRRPAGLLDAYRAEVLSEVADLLMRADETAAALLVDRLREAGESRG